MSLKTIISLKTGSIIIRINFFITQYIVLKIKKEAKMEIIYILLICAHAKQL